MAMLERSLSRERTQVRVCFGAKGNSTEVESFSRKCAAFNSLRIDSMRPGAGKKRPVSVLSSAQPQKQVLRFDCRRAKLGRLITSEKNYTPRFFCVAFKH